MDALLSNDEYGVEIAVFEAMEALGLTRIVSPDEPAVIAADVAYRAAYPNGLAYDQPEDDA